MVLAKQIPSFLSRSIYHCYILFTGRLVRIPYCGRFRLVLSEEMEDFLHQKNKKSGFADTELKLLPPSDRRVSLAESISKKLIDAINEGLMLDKGYKINGRMYRSSFSKQDKKQSGIIWKPWTQHMNGKDWDIYVAENFPGLGLCSDPGRKILISATLLPDRAFLTQAEETEIAACIGHELGHAVSMQASRYIYHYHSSKVTLPLLLGSLMSLDVANFFDLALPVVFLLKELWIICYERRCEADADYIGLMLMASAGYDPRVVPSILLKYGTVVERGFFFDLSAVKRAKFLNRNKVMKEAVKIYEDVKAGNGVKSFV